MLARDDLENNGQVEGRAAASARSSHASAGHSPPKKPSGACLDEQQRELKQLARRAKKLGYSLIEAAPPAAESLT